MTKNCVFLYVPYNKALVTTILCNNYDTKLVKFVIIGKRGLYG
jgi:hypothetical protein